MLYTIKIITLSLLLSLFAVVGAQGSPLQDDNTRSFHVEVKGSGQPMIFIPGLATDGAVWDETVAHYQKTHACHVLTLAGFAKQPPIETTAFLETVRDDLIAYIQEQKLEDSIIVGHSLGGFLALWTATVEPDLASRLIIVDSLPYLGAAQLPTATPETMKPQAEQMRNAIGNQTQEQFHQAQAMILPTMITDSLDVARALKTGGQSDPKTVGQAMYELFTIDLREAVARVKVPTLVLGTWIGYKDYGVTREQTMDTFTAQYAKVENAQITLMDKAKHFIMLDDLEGMISEIDGFLAIQ